MYNSVFLLYKKKYRISVFITLVVEYAMKFFITGTHCDVLFG